MQTVKLKLAFYISACDNFKQSRIQGFVYLLQMILTVVDYIPYNGNKCQLIILLQINSIKGLIFELSALHDYGYSQPNSMFSRYF